MKRITVGSRVSTEAWRFDSQGTSTSDRWSYIIFGEKWQNARVFGEVTKRIGEKFEVIWDIDGEKSVFEMDCLCKEDSG